MQPGCGSDSGSHPFCEGDAAAMVSRAILRIAAACAVMLALITVAI
jgi:hypothetical protein